ncbi:hypothetical protein HDU89_003843 [Geranomyces variabilis]|nr:hypothetical protein HDU89_003843 [Geranomyces variabilis]
MFGNSRAGARKDQPKATSPSRPQKDATRDSRDYGDGEPNTLPKQVTEVQSEININWDFMTAADFNPVPHALSLLDESSLGRDYAKFCDIYSKLEKAMDLIVNDYHQAFNIAIQTFSSVVENITDSQRRVVDSRKKLEDSKEWLQCKRFDLMHLWLKSIQHKEIARILDAIEDLQTTPDRLEALIQGKYYLTAVRLLFSSIRALDDGDCAEIGALELVRQRLYEIRDSLHETLIEELHNHVYLKSAFSLYRLDAVPDSGANADDRYQGSRGPDGPEKRRGVPRPKPASDPIERLKKIDDDREITEDLEANPETDSFHYILCLIEALFMLGRLREALELVRDRLPVELYYVVERTVQEADRGYAAPPTATSAEARRQLLLPGQQDPNLLGTTPRAGDARVLLRFLRNLFRKFESIIQAHSFIQAVIKMINQRSPEFKLEGLYTLREVWYSAQNELKAMLYEYVSSVTHKDADAAPVSLNDILKDKRRAKTRGDNQSLFSVVGTETADVLALYRAVNPTAEEIAITAAAVRPQLDEAGEEGGEGGDGASMGIVDAYAANSVVTGHRLLIDSDPSNILVVFDPTSAFVMRMEGMLSVKFGNLRTFLDEFVLSVFLPSMESRVLAHFHTHVNGVDAFAADFAVELSPYPLAKSATALTVLVHSICRAMPVVPVHGVEVVRMVEVVIRGYYEKCLARFNALTSSNQPGADGGYSSIVSASWVRDDTVAEVLAAHSLLPLDSKGNPNRELSEALHQKETFVELKLKKDRSFHRSELLLEQRTLQSIASLHHSIEWFYNQTNTLLAVATPAPSTLAGSDAPQWSADSLQSYTKLSSDSLPDLQIEDAETLALPLSAERSSMFANLLQQFRSLSTLCLSVLRVEIRCHAMYFLDLAMREGSYQLDDEAQEPDPYIALLNTDLSTVEEALSAVLPPSRTRFIFDGLAFLISQILMANLPHVRGRTNAHGRGKLARNVASLQQSLTNVSSVHNKSLDRAKEYFELLMLTPEALLEYGKSCPGRFSFDEYKAVLDAMFGVTEMTSPGGDDDHKRQQYAVCVQKLKDWFVNH